MALCETKVKGNDSGSYSEIYESLKDLVGSADTMAIPEQLRGDSEHYRGKLKSVLQDIRVESWKKGNKGVARFIIDELTGLIPKNQLPRDPIAGSSVSPSLANQEATVPKPGQIHVSLETILDLPKFKVICC